MVFHSIRRKNLAESCNVLPLFFIAVRRKPGTVPLIITPVFLLTTDSGYPLLEFGIAYPCLAQFL